MRLSNRVAVITGSGRGIGRAIAIAFAKEGSSVVVNARHAEYANNVVKEIGKLGGKAVAVTGDVSIKEEAGKIVNAAVENFGKIDILALESGGETNC